MEKYSPVNLLALEDWASHRQYVGLLDEAPMRIALAIEHLALVLAQQQESKSEDSTDQTTEG